MGNCISKINEDHFFACKEFIKMTFSFQTELKGLSLTGLLGGAI